MEHHASGQQQGASSQGNSTLDFNSLLLGSGPQPFHQAQYAGQYASSSSSPSSSSLTSFLHQEDSLPAYGDPRSASSADFSSSLLSSTPAAQVGTSQQLPSQNLAYPLISRTNEGKKDQQPIITMQQQPEYHHAPSSGSSGLQIPQQQTSSQSHQPQQSAYPQRFQQGPSQNLSGGAARLQPSYPVLETPGHDPVQNLLDSYPSPQTENQKIVKMLEIIAGHIQEHHKRFNNFVVNMEERLGGLEAAVSQLVLNDPELSKRMEACGRREDKERESQKERERSTSRHHISGSSTSGKKKKKTKTTPDHETELYTRSAAGTSSRDVAGEEIDEELARKLQAQFNAEAEIEALKKESITLADEEYAQKLQGLYLKSDPQSGKRGLTTSAPATPVPKKDTPKKPSPTSSKAEEKSLWSRLFGPSKPESDEESDEDDDPKLAPKKTEITTTYPATGRGTSLMGTGMVPMSYYYPTGLPQHQFMVPQGYAPYPMALPPGHQYTYPAPSGSTAQSTNQQ